MGGKSASILTCGLALLTTLLPVRAQLDADCENTLAALTDQISTVCCTPSSNCAGTNAFPATCSLDCGGLWYPFEQRCSDFVRTNFPDLEEFSQNCRNTCAGGACSGDGNDSPPPPGQASYTTIMLQTDGAYSTSDLAFEGGLRQDLATALDVPNTRVVIQSFTDSSITIDIFHGRGQIGGQEFVQRLQGQLADEASTLRTGEFSNHISAQQTLTGTVQTVDTSTTAGTVTVRVDDSAEVYFNGNLLGSTEGWTDIQTFNFDAPCGTTSVLSIHGVDTNGPAAIIASWEHCGHTTTTDLGCKCTEIYPDGDWTSATFDDSSWPSASDGGINGADPWGFTEGVEPLARWIWAQDQFGADEAYCRCVEGHQAPTGLTRDGHGQFHIRVDDTSSIYANGQLVGETVPAQWTEDVTFEFNQPCDQPTVYAIDGSDAYGVSAFIGDINHCGEAIQTIPTRWKCSTVCPDGWEGVDFDDSNWEYAVDAGINGVDPWGPTDVSPNAHWIWTQDTNNDDRACCRYLSDHQIVNCNAARTRYTNDYVDVSNSNGYAYTHYQTVGQAEGRIWHSELCDPEGPGCPSSCPDVDHDGDDTIGQFHICVDDGYSFYVNGVETSAGEDYTQVDAGSFTADCDTPTTYVIEGYDTGGIGSMIAEINHCGELILSSSAWQCISAGSQNSDYTRPGFDFSDWDMAGDAGDNGAEPWGQRRDISGEAHWIWSPDPYGEDNGNLEHNRDYVYCAYTSHHMPLDCPAAQARYMKDYRDIGVDMTAYGFDSFGMEAYNHYTQYGMNEGRIWHSELCSEDGTNKNSVCQVKHTDADYNYDYFGTQLGPNAAITFSVRAHNDAHIGFFESRQSGGSASGEGPQYEIVLCGWGGTQSVIREEAQGENHATTDMTGYIDENDFRQFWASASNGLIRLGAGNVVGFNVIMQWQDPDAILDIKYAAVATGWGSEGDWVVCMPERCTGYFSATEATLGTTATSGYTGGPVICHGQDTQDGTHTVDHGACDAHAGYTGSGYVDYQNNDGDFVKFNFEGCDAGDYSLVFRYAFGQNDNRLGLAVNGISQRPVHFHSTGGWDDQDWSTVSVQVTLADGHNTVALSGIGEATPNLNRVEVEKSSLGITATRQGVATITADNGYIFYVDGNRVGAGGAVLDPSDPGYDRDGWQNTDRWHFYASCDTPTAFAIEAVDSEGVASVMAQITHCGSTIYTGTQWKCQAANPFGYGADRQYIAIDTPMNWDEANTYCTQNYAGLASIHSMEQQLLANAECAKLVTVDEVPISSCSASSEYSDQYSCEHAYDNNGVADSGEFAVRGADNCDSPKWIQLNFATGQNIGSMMYEQRWAEVDWVVAGTVEYSDGSPIQNINFDQSHDFVSYPLQPPVTGSTDFVKVSFTEVKYDLNSSPPASAGNTNPTCNIGAKELQFFEADRDGLHHNGCWIGLSDQNQEARLSWTDGSAVDFTWWALGEPNNVQEQNNEDFVEMDFRVLGTNTNSDGTEQHFNNRGGQWNDNENGGDSNANPEYPLCQTAIFTEPIETDYIGCYIDSDNRVMDGTGGAYFEMGDDASVQKCAQLCAGYLYLGLQYGSQCFCDNANYASLGVADDSDCNVPCNGAANEMCGGGWRNSVYHLSTNFWEMPGFDDRTWAAAQDMGPNGIAPWYKRPNINDDAHWIWTSEPNQHDHIFCRYVNPNTELNCPAAEAKYLQDYPEIRESGFPAWQHYQDVGKAEGRYWHEDLCNVCTPSQMMTNCHYPDGNYHFDADSAAICNDNLCSNKCIGMHDAAQATLVGAVVAPAHGPGHGDFYGTGFVDYQNPTGDSVLFTIEQCNAGRHLLEFTYSLASNDPPRPLQVTINGGSGGDGSRTSFTLLFPATGSWEEWGTVRHRADLLQGTNTIELTAMENSGPNLDSLEVYPNGDQSIGHWRGNMDNSGQFYVNNQLIGGPAGTGWDTTTTFTFTEDCSQPTVYAVHVTDDERDEDGQHNVGGVIGSITHCNEVIVTNANWRCYAADMTSGQPPPVGWNEASFDDSAWERATVYGTATGHDNHWNQYTEAQDPPYHIPGDAVARNAKWIWTLDSDTHDDVYCRYVNRHEFEDCAVAAARYLQDYPDVADAPEGPFDHFKTYGQWQGRTWHSELCKGGCEIESTPVDWIDATDGGIQATPEDLDEGTFVVDLPFAFPFFGQEKTRAYVNVNGYLTFSGDSTNRPYAPQSIPSPSAPNDLIAPYWFDMDMTTGGAIWTKAVGGEVGGSCTHGIANGQACCVATCGQCGGRGCGTFPGGADACCHGNIVGDDTHDPKPLCRDNFGHAPCVIDEEFFVIEWADIPSYGAQNSAYAGQTAHFEVILYESGQIRFQYQDIFHFTDESGDTQNEFLFVAGIENAAGSEGRVINDLYQCQDSLGHDVSWTQGMDATQCDRVQNFVTPTSLVLIDSCGSDPRAFSVGWCAGYNGQDHGANGDTNTGGSCTYEEAEEFCQVNYGGQLASITTQGEFDTMNQMLPPSVGQEQFLLGLHADGRGNWEYSDNTQCGDNCLSFLRSHSHDGLLGTTEVNLVWTPVQPDDQKMDDCCNCQAPCGGWDNIEGFVCELYTAPGAITIGLGRTWEDANAFCQTAYGGSLLSVHSQEVYDKLSTLANGYTNPIMIGLHSDGAGNWEWADGSDVDMDFLRAHSADNLAGVGETVAVFYAPTDADDPGFNGLHDWGGGDVPMAFACSASGHVPSNPTWPSTPADGGGH